MHIEHGIGKFLGIKTLDFEDYNPISKEKQKRKHDFLHLEYQNHNKLYLSLIHI